MPLLFHRCSSLLCLLILMGTGSWAQPAPEAAPLVPSAPDTAASVRWSLLAFEAQAESQRLRLQHRIDAARGDTAAHRSSIRFPDRLATPYPWALLALAQRDASRLDGSVQTRAAAVAGASAEVIIALWPNTQPWVADRLRSALRADSEGVAAGQRIARQRITAVSDSVGSAHDLEPPPPESGSYRGALGWMPHPGTHPDGLNVPTHPLLVLDRADRFRPPPPPRTGSSAFAAALAEVQTVAASRTAAQRRASRYWARRSGHAEWTRRAAHHLAEAHTSDPDAAETLAILQTALTDATIACWEAKYHYGLLRPEHADSTLTRPWGVALPNFPAYPAGHACTAGAAETVLVRALPGADDDIRAAAGEMAVSRLWGGVHYRFDNDAGFALGRAVAEYVLGQIDASGTAP